MTRPSKLRAVLPASILAAALSAPLSAADAGDFVVVDGAGVAGSLDPVYAPVPAPWSGSAFRAEFPDIGYLPEATVAAWPKAAPSGRGKFGGGNGTHASGNLRDDAASFASSRFTIHVRPGF